MSAYLSCEQVAAVKSVLDFKSDEEDEVTQIRNLRMMK